MGLLDHSEFFDHPFMSKWQSGVEAYVSAIDEYGLVPQFERGEFQPDWTEAFNCEEIVDCFQEILAGKSIDEAVADAQAAIETVIG